jgi:DNA-directed RNA polymerase subunit M/transcription elongation factor TFIIS
MKPVKRLLKTKKNKITQNPKANNKSKPAREENEEWRENIRKKLESLVEDYKIASEIESAVYEVVTFTVLPLDIADELLFKNFYLSHITKLILNLDPNSYVGNENLVKKVKNKEISPKELVQKTPIELFPEKWEELKKKKDEKEKFLYINQRKATSNRLICRACRKNEVSYTMGQTRSADEPMTIFYECLNCGKKWNT